MFFSQLVYHIYLKGSLFYKYKQINLFHFHEVISIYKNHLLLLIPKIPCMGILSLLYLYRLLQEATKTSTCFENHDFDLFTSCQLKGHFSTAAISQCSKQSDHRFRLLRCRTYSLCSEKEHLLFKNFAEKSFFHNGPPNATLLNDLAFSK